MAIVQGLLTMLSRYAGKIVNTVFGWATAMLFGKVPPNRQIFLSLMSFGSVLWIVVAMGVAFPKAGVFLLSFVKLPDSIGEGWVRLGMLAATLLLPLVVGLLSLPLLDPADRPRGRERLKMILKGYPYTFGLAVTLSLLLLLAPISKLRDLARRRQNAHVQIIVEPEDYRSTSEDVARALRKGGFEVQARKPGWMTRFPIAIMTTFAGGGFRNLVAEELVSLNSPEIEALLLPFDLVLSGRPAALLRARSLLTEELVFTPAYLTWEKEANEIEDRFTGIWNDFQSSRLGQDEAIAAVRKTGRDLRRLKLPYEEWEILYREEVILERRLLLGRKEQGPVFTPDSLWQYLASNFELGPKAREALKGRFRGLAQSRLSGLLAPFLARWKKEAGIAAAALLVAARLALSPLVKFFVNRALGKGGSFRGRIGGFGLGFLRGRVAVSGVHLAADSPGLQARVDVARVVVNWSWTRLLKGWAAFEVLVDRPEAVLDVRLPEEGEEQESSKESAAAAEPWQKRARELFPFELEKLRVCGGSLRVNLWNGRVTPVWADHIEVELRGVSNRGGTARLDGTAKIMGRTDFCWHAEGEPFADSPSFHAAADLEELDLAQFNPLLSRFAGLDLASGAVQLFLEAIARDGRVSGYAKPIVTRLVLAGGREEKAGLGRYLKENAVDLITRLLATGDDRRIAIKVPFSGPLERVAVDKSAALRSLLANAVGRPVHGGFEARTPLPT